jgi:putative CocE/NonD family hydrolase
MLDAFRRLRLTRARDDQRLVVGPWGHGVFGDLLGDVSFGPSASLATLAPSALQLDFFTAVLAGEPPPGPPVRLFVMGANRWRDEEEWPLARAAERRLHLHAGGRLLPDPPRDAQPPDRYDYDPRSPVPTCGGAVFLPGLATGSPLGPRDQTAIERRDDVLVYTSDRLEEEWEVTGDVAVALHAATTAPATDWTAKLVDVWPDGRPLGVCDGILRTRYGGGAPERYEIALGSTSMLFRRGHRIRLEVSSSNFPRFDRNPNSGGVIAEATADDLVVARQSVFHDADHPSYVALPVVAP